MKRIYRKVVPERLTSTDTRRMSGSKNFVNMRAVIFNTFSNFKPVKRFQNKTVVKGFRDYVQHHASTSSSTEGGSESNLLIQGV